MDDIRLTVAKARCRQRRGRCHHDRHEGGIYIEDYDIEQQVAEIAHVDLIERGSCWTAPVTL